MHKRILVADDERNMRWAIKRALEGEDYIILEAATGLEALEHYREKEPHLVIMDLKMPDMDGISALTKMKEIKDTTPIIMITAHGTVESAIEAMKLGAMDYISKPFDIEELMITIEKALGYGELKEEVCYLREELGKSLGKPIIGKSQGLQNTLETVNRVAKTNASVLILGESGTGKELIANAIHYNSGRRNKPYIKINCGAIPENLLESELFGYEKGAFTGAASRKVGRIERANGGTLFLDEVGELPFQLQVKLLRILQEREIDRIGGTEPIKVDVRIIAATNRDLLTMVEEGTFREDLYYRLNVIPIKMPPLRERKEDIPILVNHFLSFYCNEIGRGRISLQKDAMDKLVEYPWRGNIRELENVIERMVILSDEEVIRSCNLPRELLLKEEINNSYQLPEEGIKLEELERDLLIQALQRTEHNQTKAAKLLGISRHTLIYRMEKFGLNKL